MGKKMKLPAFILKNKETSSSSSSANQHWQWPSCKQPKTLSFRAGDDIFKTINSVFFDPSDWIETPETWFTNSSESASISTASEEFSAEESLEMIIRGVQSERLFFEPQHTNSILGTEAKVEACDDEVLPFKESVVLAMESEDPYEDFKRSMQEMIETHGLKDWECLEELLGWYLKMNAKKHHGFIVEAFVDLLIGLASSCSDSTSFFSADSSFSSPSSPLSPLGQREINNEDRIEPA